MKAKYGKFHLLIPYHDVDVYINIDIHIIKGSKSGILLGINIDNNFPFDKHVSILCDKASQRLHALARISKYVSILCDKANQKLLALPRISKYVSNHKLKVLMKSFILSQFGYCPLVWILHSKTLNNRINRLHERALKLAYKDNFSNFQELLDKDNPYTIHERNLKIACC